MTDRSRRHVLGVGCVSAFSLALAGCSSLPLGRTCELHHEVWEEGEDGGYGGQRIEYTELSDRGKAAFRKALKDGGYVLSYRGDNAPPDFSYSDDASPYVVEYEGTSYTLLTYTSQGCTVG